MIVTPVQLQESLLVRLSFWIELGQEETLTNAFVLSAMYYTDDNSGITLQKDHKPSDCSYKTFVKSLKSQ